MESESLEEIRFGKSLQELNDLRTQLYSAADYCEASFMRAHDRKAVIENTKRYIRQAVVTVVDHLGNVSSNLDSLISNEISISNTELRINCLNQKLSTWQDYSQKIASAKLRWNVLVPRNHLRYILNRPDDNDTDMNAVRKIEVLEEVGTNPRNCTSSQLEIIKWGHISSAKVHRIVYKPKSRHTPPFHFQHNHKMCVLPPKPAQRHGFLGLLRRSKRAP